MDLFGSVPINCHSMFDARCMATKKTWNWIIHLSVRTHIRPRHLFVCDVRCKLSTRLLWTFRAHFSLAATCGQKPNRKKGQIIRFPLLFAIVHHLCPVSSVDDRLIVAHFFLLLPGARCQPSFANLFDRKFSEDSIKVRRRTKNMREMRHVAKALIISWFSQQPAAYVHASYILKPQCRRNDDDEQV